VSHTLRLVRIAVFAALSVVGSFIRLPSPIPSVAFDSASEFFAALYYRSVEVFVSLVSGMWPRSLSAISRSEYASASKSNLQSPSVEEIDLACSWVAFADALNGIEDER